MIGENRNPTDDRGGCTSIMIEENRNLTYDRRGGTPTMTKNASQENRRPRFLYEPERCSGRFDRAKRCFISFLRFLLFSSYAPGWDLLKKQEQALNLSKSVL